MYEHDVSRGAFGTVSAVFASLGRHLLCLDENFRVLHASPTLRDLLCTDAALEGRPVADILGPDLFGAGGAMRDALLSGERREGWHALIPTTQGIRPLAVTSAPLQLDDTAACDPRGRYVVMVMAAAEDHFATASSPAVLSGLIARSGAMSRLFQLVENLQSSDAPVRGRASCACCRTTRTSASAARVADARLRLGFFAGIHVVPVEIPPLRARREDIEPLARLLLRRVGEQHGRHLRFSPEVIRMFLEYGWPGNVQELEIAIEGTTGTPPAGRHGRQRLFGHVRSRGAHFRRQARGPAKP